MDIASKELLRQLDEEVRRVYARRYDEIVEAIEHATAEVDAHADDWKQHSTAAMRHSTSSDEFRAHWSKMNAELSAQNSRERHLQALKRARSAAGLVEETT